MTNKTTNMIEVDARHTQTSQPLNQALPEVLKLLSRIWDMTSFWFLKLNLGTKFMKILIINSLSLSLRMVDTMLIQCVESTDDEVNSI